MDNPFVGAGTGNRVDGKELYQFFGVDDPDLQNLSVEEILREHLGLDGDAVEDFNDYFSKLAFPGMVDENGKSRGNVLNMTWNDMMKRIEEEQVYKGDVANKSPKELEEELSKKINSYTFKDSNGRDTGKTFADFAAPKIIKRRTEKFESRQPTEIKKWMVKKAQREQELDVALNTKIAVKRKYKDDVDRLNAEQKQAEDDFVKRCKLKGAAGGSVARRKEQKEGLEEIQAQYAEKRQMLDNNYKEQKKHLPKGRKLRGAEKRIQKMFNNDNEMFSIIPLWAWLALVPAICIIWNIVGFCYVLFA